MTFSHAIFWRTDSSVVVVFRRLTHGSVGGLELELQLRGFIRSMRGRKCRNSSGTGLKEEVKGRFERSMPSFFSFFLAPQNVLQRLTCFHSNTTGVQRNCGISPWTCVYAFRIFIVLEKQLGADFCGASMCRAEKKNLSELFTFTP